MSGALVSGHGLAVRLPQRWEARLYLRDSPQAAASGDEAVASSRRALLGLGRRHPYAYGHPGELMHPVLHMANFALPPGRGDFGTGAVEIMGAEHAFVSLLEYEPALAKEALFSDRGLPRPRVGDFAPNSLQRRIAGQLGCQKFFNQGGRAFCVYMVLGSRAAAPRLVGDIRTLLSGIEVGAR